MTSPLRNDMKKVVNLSVQRFLNPLFQGTLFLCFLFYTLSYYAGRDCLTQGENAKCLKLFSGVRPSSKFSPREIRKPAGDTTKPTGEDMKIQWGELMKILLWVKNIHTWFFQKRINGWVTFHVRKSCKSCQKKLHYLSNHP